MLLVDKALAADGLDEIEDRIREERTSRSTKEAEEAGSEAMR